MTMSLRALTIVNFLILAATSAIGIACAMVHIARANEDLVEIRASKFVVVDENGRERIALGLDGYKAYLEIYGTGRDEICVALDNSGSGSVVISGRAPSITLTDMASEDYVGMAVDTTYGGVVSVGNLLDGANGRMICTDGDCMLSLSSASGRFCEMGVSGGSNVLTIGSGASQAEGLHVVVDGVKSQLWLEGPGDTSLTMHAGPEDSYVLVEQGGKRKWLSPRD